MHLEFWEEFLPIQHLLFLFMRFQTPLIGAEEILKGNNHEPPNANQDGQNDSFVSRSRRNSRENHAHRGSSWEMENDPRKEYSSYWVDDLDLQSLELIPFTRRIIEETLPRRFSAPHLDSYDRTSDPEAYLAKFRMAMFMTKYSDRALCKVFPMTLKGAVQIWFSSLEPSVISSFTYPAVRFRSQFISNIRPRKRLFDLFRYRQRSGEASTNT